MQKETLLKIIRWGCYISLALPLFLSTKFFYPFVFPRTALFRIIIDILLVFYLVLIIKFPEYRPKRNALFLSAIAFIGILILTTLTSIDPSKSFLGTMERGRGLVSWLHYFAFFVVLISAFKHEKEWQRIFNISIAVGLIVSLYALGQRMGLPSLIESGLDRATGTIGNAAFLGSYLVLNIGLVLISLLKMVRLSSFGSNQAISFSSVGQRIFYFIALFFNSLALYLTLTRGAIIGAAAGFFIFVILYLFINPSGGGNKSIKEKLKEIFSNRIKRYLAISLLVVIVFFAFIITFRNYPFIKNTQGLSRIANISLEETTAQTRILAWQSAWQGWEEKFWLGWGPENFNIVFNRHFNPQFYRFSSGETWFDHAHNIIFDIGATSGLLGVLAYLSLFGSAFYLLWRKRTSGFLVAICLASVLVAYFVQNLFVFDVFNSYLIFFLLLAYIYFFAENSAERSLSSNEESQLAARKNKRLNRANVNNHEMSKIAITAVSLFSLVIAIVAWQLSAKPLIADYWAAEVYREANSPEGKKALGDPQKANEAYEKVLNLYRKALSFQSLGDPEVRIDLSGFAVLHTENKEIKPELREEGFLFAIAQMKKSREEHLYNAQWYLFSAKLSQSYAQLKEITKQDNAVLLKEAEQFIRQGIDLSPKKYALQFVLVQVLIMQERYQEALERAQAITNSDFKLSDAYWYLGLAYLGVKNETASKETIDQALDLHYSFQNADDAILAATLFAHFNDYQRLENIYRQLVRLEPRNTQWLASLATVYSKLGNKEKAEQTAYKILDIDPFAEDQVKEFIKGL